MKQFRFLMTPFLGIALLLFSACDLLVDGATQAAPLPTAGNIAVVDTSDPTLPDPTEPPIEPTAIIVIEPTATPLPIGGGGGAATSPIEPSTLTPTPTPATVTNGCLAPSIPEGLTLISYVVQPGDTLFKIGLAANPQMTVDQVAQVNCITDVNRIDVGQDLSVWAPIKPIGAHQLITFTDGQYGRIGRYNGPMQNETLSFQIEVNGDEDLTLFSHTGQFPEIQFNVARKNDLTKIGSIKTTERHYANTNLRGKHFDLPSGGSYLVMAIAEPNTLLNLEFILGGPTFPQLGNPADIYGPGLTGLDLGKVIEVEGENLIGEYDRYQFFGKAGYLLDLNAVDTSNLVLIVENSQEQVMLAPPMGGGGNLILPADDTYTIYLFHGGSHDFLYGPYTFSIQLTDTTVQNEAQRIQFDPGTTGTNLSGQNEDRAITNYTFTATAGQRADFTIVDVGNSGFWIEDMAGNRLFNMYGPSFGSFLLPYSGDYKMAVYNAAGYGDHGFVAGNFNILFDIVEYPGPVIGLQEPIPFEFTAGAQSASLIGENEDDHVARYAFTASAGQELHLSFFQDPTLGVWIEDAEGNQLIHTVGRVNSSLWLPETGEYTVSIYRGGSEGYRGGPYEVFLFLIDG